MTDYSLFISSSKERDSLFSAFFFNSPVMQVLTEASTGKILEVNDRFCRFYDYDRNELLGKTLIELNIMVNPNDREMIVRRVMQEGSVHDIEILERAKCGALKWISASVNMLRLFGRDCFLGIGIDITGKKVLETELKKINADLEEKVKERTQEIRHFTEYLHQAQEDERARISREIHDELGQQLIGMKMGLTSFKKKYSPGGETLERIDSMIADIDNAIGSMKKIITQLRPGILDTLGLIPSIGWLAKEFENKTGITCRFRLLPIEGEYSKKISTCFFRVCQEALNNIAKHSNATEVEILIGQEEGKIMLKVSDNGIGIPQEQIANPFSFGLTGMRERAIIIDGELEISSEVKKGTTVLLKAKAGKEGG